MKRVIVIEEEFGQFKVSTKLTGASGATLESALGKLAVGAPDEYVHHAAEVLEPLLGPKDDGASGGQIHTGVVSG